MSSGGSSFLIIRGVQGVKTCGLAGGLLMLWHGIACSQDYPSARALRILTSQPGSGSDLVARILVERLPEVFGQHAVVDNRGILAPEVAAKAPPDGYTVLFYSTPLWVSPLLQAKPQWNVAKDFAPVTLAVNAPNLLTVHPSLSVKSVGELLVLAKARPGELDYGSGSAGSSSHLAAELFNAMAGVHMARIPYRGVGPALVGLLGGQVQVLFPSASSGLPHVKSGRMRVLAVTSAKPTALLPDLPTVAASGVPGYEADTPLGVFLPAGTPAKIIAQLHKAIIVVLNFPEAKKRLLAHGAEVIGSSPAEFGAWLESDVARWSKLIREKGMREEL